MSFFTFLEEKITEILFQLFFLAVVAFLLIFYGVDTLFVVSLVILFISIQGLFQWCLYRKKRNASQHIIDLVDGLEENYYIADVLPKPKEFQNKAYCYALKKACNVYIVVDMELTGLIREALIKMILGFDIALEIEEE